MDRRKFIKAGLICSIPALGLGYARFLEPTWLEVTFRKIRLGQGDQPIRILHLSDFHYHSENSIDFLSRAFNLGVSEKPDLICITGDFIEKRPEDLEKLSKALKILSSSAPVLACAGNHDGGDWARGLGGYPDTSVLQQVLEESDIVLLQNESKTVQVRDSRICFTGLEDFWAGNFNITGAFPDSAEDKMLPKILLSHNPDTKELLWKKPWNLMLCGHTHGGQMRIPFLGSPLAPVRDKDFVEGLKTWQGRYIHINRGLGSFLGIRINCRPEISILDIYLPAP